MPAVHFCIRWPNGEEEKCYSPSTIIHDYFNAGDAMSVNEFMSIVTKALRHASRRVEARFGYACSSASDQLSRLQKKSNEFHDDAGSITILSMKAG